MDSQSLSFRSYNMMKRPPTVLTADWEQTLDSKWIISISRDELLLMSIFI